MSVDPLNQEEFASITTMINAKDVVSLVKFYESVFGFQTLECMKDSFGKMYARMRYRGSSFMIMEEDLEKMMPAPSSIKGTSASFYVYTEDVDSFTKMLEEKETVIGMPVSDMPWGDRCSVAIDPEGHAWMFATHKFEPQM
jgi:uncharacterized glyoxalase superfamily protein PhnB